jgi:hypothetical protein
VYPSRPRNPSGETAKTLILIGLIFQAIEVAVVVGIGAVFLIVPFLGAIFLAVGVIGILWIVLVYVFSYQRTSEGDFDGARTPTLVFGILSLITVNLISGILYIIAYAKLGDAEGESTPIYSTFGTAPAPTGMKFCSSCGRANAFNAGFCASCGTRLT